MCAMCATCNVQCACWPWAANWWAAEIWRGLQCFGRNSYSHPSCNALVVNFKLGQLHPPSTASSTSPPLPVIATLTLAGALPEPYTQIKRSQKVRKARMKTSWRCKILLNCVITAHWRLDRDLASGARETLPMWAGPKFYQTQLPRSDLSKKGRKIDLQPHVPLVSLSANVELRFRTGRASRANDSDSTNSGWNAV